MTESPAVPTIKTPPNCDFLDVLRAMYRDTIRQGRPSIRLKLAIVAEECERTKDEPRPRYRSKR